MKKELEKHIQNKYRSYKIAISKKSIKTKIIEIKKGVRSQKYNKKNLLKLKVSKSKKVLNHKIYQKAFSKKKC